MALTLQEFTDEVNKHWFSHPEALARFVQIWNEAGLDEIAFNQYGTMYAEAVI